MQQKRNTEVSLGESCKRVSVGRKIRERGVTKGNRRVERD